MTCLHCSGSQGKSSVRSIMRSASANTAQSLIYQALAAHTLDFIVAEPYTLRTPSCMPQINGRTRRVLVIEDNGVEMPDTVLRERFFNLGHTNKGTRSLYSK